MQTPDYFWNYLPLLMQIIVAVGFGAGIVTASWLINVRSFYISQSETSAGTTGTTMQTRISSVLSLSSKAGLSAQRDKPGVTAIRPQNHYKNHYRAPMAQ